MIIWTTFSSQWFIALFVTCKPLWVLALAALRNQVVVAQSRCGGHRVSFYHHHNSEVHSRNISAKLDTKQGYMAFFVSILNSVIYHDKWGFHVHHVGCGLVTELSWLHVTGKSRPGCPVLSLSVYAEAWLLSLLTLCCPIQTHPLLPRASEDS